MHQTRLLVDADYDILFGVIVSRERPVRVVFVFRWAFEVEQSLALASQLVGPLAALDAVVVEEALGRAALGFRHAPLADEVVNGAVVAGGEDTELPGTARTR